MDKIREAFEDGNLGDYLRERFIGLGDIELTVSDLVELVQDVYKSRDEEIKKLRDALERIANNEGELYESDARFMRNIAKETLKDGAS